MPAYDSACYVYTYDLHIHINKSTKRAELIHVCSAPRPWYCMYVHMYLDPSSVRPSASEPALQLYCTPYSIVFKTRPARGEARR